jgi:branched-chain amino acid transport system permease protein
MGYTGQISFGQNAFAALGGYISAILTTDHGWPPLVALVLAAVASSLLALVVGYPTLRLRGHYLAMATLALGLITYEVAVQWQSLTQGYLGIAGIPPLGIGRWELLDDRLTLLAVLAVVALGLWVSYRLKRSRFGRALGAIAGDEDAARALGVDVTRHKLAAFAVAAAYASISGSMFAHVVQFISPEVFGLHMVVLGFTMLYVGGIGTIFGPLIGAMIISLLPEALRGFKEYQDLVYGIALIVILIFAPKGLSSLTHLSSQLLGIARKRP